MANKVRFGVKNVYYATLTVEGNENTFGAPVALKGAVNISLTAEGDTNTFYADDTAYVAFNTNSGYTGELELAFLEDAAKVALLGEITAGNGVVYEDASAQPSQVALLFEFEGNVANQRHVLYNVTFSRPDLEGNTTTDSTDPDTTTLSFTAIPLPMTIGTETKNVTKGSLEYSSSTATVYNGWFTNVVVPTAGA